MKQTTFLSITLFIFFSASIYAQNLSGTLLSQKSNETIPYASVQIGENYGVITNNKGDFQINVDRFTGQDSLYFSSLGYKEKRIAVKDFQQEMKIYLSEDVNQLDDVYLVNKNLSSEEIMEKVNENISQNYNLQLKKFDVFVRNQTISKLLDTEFEVNKATFLEKKVRKKFNQSLDSLLSVNKNSLNTSYTESYAQILTGIEKDSLKVAVKKATQLKDESKAGNAEEFSSEVFKKIAQNLNSENTFKVKSGILPLEDSLKVGKAFKVNNKKKDSVFTKEVKESYASKINRSKNLNPGRFDFVKDYEDYTFTQEKITAYNGEMVYILNFQPDKGRAKYNGRLYISAETFAIIKAEYKLEKGKKAAGFNMKFLLGIKFSVDKDNGLVIFKRNVENTYDPVYLKRSTHQYAYLNRSLKFKENTDDRSNRIKFKFDLLVENETTEDQEILFVKSDSITEETFDSFQENKGILVEKIKNYDSSIWEGYNIISPDRELEEFKY